MTTNVEEYLSRFREAKAARRIARKQHLYSRIAAVAGTEPVPRTAAQRWNFAQEDIAEGMSVNQYGHPANAAIMTVRQALADFNLPGKPELRYVGMKRISGHGPHAVEEGVIVIEAVFQALSGHRLHVDIPVPVIDGRALQPSILIESGLKRVLTQNTFDEILKRSTFTQPVSDRKNMYAQPHERSDASVPRSQVPKIHGGMFAIPTRSRIASALRGYATPAVGGGDDDGARAAFYSPQITGRTKPGEKPFGADGSDLDPAERDQSDYLTPGQTVRTKRDVVIGDRGGNEYILSRGTRGRVVRDVDGCGKAYLVSWDEVGMRAAVARQDLA